MPAYVIYARKSTESEDRQVLSIDSQTNELRAIAMRRGISIAEVLTESRSAKAPGRPVFSELMRRVAKGAIQGILCWKMDRLARNHLDTGVVLQALADGKLAEVITSDRTYTRDGNDRFMGSFELGIATKYIDDLRANVKRGIRARLERGWINHIPRPGYMIDSVTKEIVVDPERFDLVRRIMHMVLDGSHRPLESRKIANEQWGFRTRKYGRVGGKPLSRTSFYEMLSNPFYAGIIRLEDGRIYQGRHRPMLSREEFDRLQEILRREGRPRYYKHHQFEFAGILKCGNCGAGVTAEQHVKTSGKRYVYYRCSRYRAGVICREPAIAERDLERQIATQLQLLAIPHDVVAWLCERTEKTFVADQARQQAAEHLLKQSIAGLDRESDNLLSLRLRDLVKDEVFVEKKKQLDDERERFATRLCAPRAVEESTRLAVRTFRFAARAGQIFTEGTTVQKRMILEAVGLNYSLKSRKVLYQLKNPLRIIAEAGTRSDWSTCPHDLCTWLQDRTEDFRIPDEIMPGAVPISP